MLVDELRRSYPDFGNIYHRHFDEAKFSVVKATEFRSLKERLLFVRHHLKERPQLDPSKRTELIQALFQEDDLRRARKVLLKSDKNKDKSSWFLKAVGMFAGLKSTDEESLRRDARKISSTISDSDFLRELKVIQDEDLVALVQAAMAHAHTYLSSLIDVTVKKMTQAVLHMQYVEGKRKVRREVETEESKALDDIRVNFIRDINQSSSGEITS
jgi:hypothetical protein